MTKKCQTEKNINLTGQAIIGYDRSIQHNANVLIFNVLKVFNSWDQVEGNRGNRLACAI